jgi:hypothetical protein
MRSFIKEGLGFIGGVGTCSKYILLFFNKNYVKC